VFLGYSRSFRGGGDGTEPWNLEDGREAGVCDATLLGVLPLHGMANEAAARTEIPRLRPVAAASE